MLQPNLVLIPLEHGGIKLDVGGDVADGLGGREFVGLLRGRSGELVAGSSLGLGELAPAIVLVDFFT